MCESLTVLSVLQRSSLLCSHVLALQHHTLGMHPETKALIQRTCEKHIANPNAIILCVQDASRDPEGPLRWPLMRAHMRLWMPERVDVYQCDHRESSTVVL